METLNHHPGSAVDGRAFEQQQGSTGPSCNVVYMYRSRDRRPRDR